MCLKCVIKAVVTALSGVQLAEELIGKVEQDLVINLRLAELHMTDVQRDVRKEVSRLVMAGAGLGEVKSIVSDKFETQYNLAQSALGQRWHAIFLSLGLDPEKEDFKQLKIDRETFNVYRLVQVDQREPEHVH